MSEQAMEITLKELEVQKLDLQPGQTLMVSVKHPDMDAESLNHLRKALKQYFPDNQVMVFGMGPEGEVKFAVVNEPQISYCSDCSCGKKERAEAQET